MTQQILMRLSEVKKTYDLRRGFLSRGARIHAVNGVDLNIERHETLGLVGESGCGKSTLSRLLTRLEKPTGGSIELDGRDIGQAQGPDLKALRARIQMVFQDPYSSLNPRMTAGQIVAEPLGNYAVGTPSDRRHRIAELFDKVGLPLVAMQSYPHEFSGGQRQRIAIARALSLNPDIIVADEPVSALDVSVQAQILNLFMDLQADFGVTIIFVSHDLSVIRHVSRRIAVMYLGRIVELADKNTLYKAPQHPYTQSLLNAVPPVHPRARRPRQLLAGDVPSVTEIDDGCAFRNRCPLAFERCTTERPVMRDAGNGGLVACHRDTK